MTFPLTHKTQLVDYLAQGCKPSSDWRIGTEYEHFLLDARTLKRFPYEGERGIHFLLEALQARGWEPVYEKNELIAVKTPHQRSSITLEPGGQLELSGAPLATLHETKAELTAYQAQMEKVLAPVEGVLLSFGVDPLWPREVIPWMPKDRYRLMRAYMPTKGTLGIDMMVRTCTVQVNLDFESEADMVAKMRIGMALQPLAKALFACSPFCEGKLNGYQSYRGHIWQHTDPDRCGFLPFVFEENMGFERYVEYLLDVPMYFVSRQGNYINALGQSFRDFMKGQLPALPGGYPIIDDWVDQTTVVFPEVRLKQFLEMRGADSSPGEMRLALPAFWVGLLYDAVAQEEAFQLIKGWTVNQIMDLYAHVPRQGLRAVMGNRSLQGIAQEVLAISQKGLQRRAKMKDGYDESAYLAPLVEIAQTGRTIATQLEELLQEAGSVEKVVRRYF